MANFPDQIESSRQSHLAVRALEESVRLQIEEIFVAWERGEESAQSVRWRLERVVRNAYRAAAAVGVGHVSAQSGIPGWRPVGVFNTPYLQGLLADVRRNLREYKASSRDPKARRRAISRIEHSAGVAATRGYTDAVLETNRELRDFGYMVRKLWLANFVNNTPCEFCQALHGTEVGLDEDFPTDRNVLKVYGDLLGPPRHPRCFVAGTEVTGPDVEAASQRVYKGELVELRFGEGRVLTGTPNHPVLTTQGWRALKDIVEGDQLVYDRRAEPSSPGPFLVGHSDDDERPSRIEDVLKALSRAAGVVATEVPSTAPDFHGDGTEGEVSVVYADGSLRHDVDFSFSKPVDDLNLRLGHVPGPVLLDASRSGQQEVFTFRNSAHSVVGGSSEQGSTFGPFSGHAEIGRVGHPSGSDILFEQKLGDDTSRYAQTLRDRQDALAFHMTSDDLRSLGLYTVDSTRHFEDSCLVYNLETVGGWYTANGIIAHNCKCRLVILHVRLENLFERLDPNDPRDGGSTDTMSTSEVQALPRGVFSLFTRGLRKIIGFLRGE